jgi:hypothetical protein
MPKNMTSEVVEKFETLLRESQRPFQIPPIQEQPAKGDRASDWLLKVFRNIWEINGHAVERIPRDDKIAWLQTGDDACYVVLRSAYRGLRANEPLKNEKQTGRGVETYTVGITPFRGKAERMAIGRIPLANSLADLAISRSYPIDETALASDQISLGGKPFETVYNWLRGDPGEVSRVIADEVFQLGIDYLNHEVLVPPRT